MTRTILLFTTGPSATTLHFQVAEQRTVLLFSTESTRVSLHFQVALPRTVVRFTTGTADTTIHFQVAEPLANLLKAELDATGTCLLVTLSSSLPAGSYSLVAVRYDTQERPTVCALNVPGSTQWSFPVGEDGLWQLLVQDGAGQVAEALVLVNFQNLRTLSRYSKRAACCDPFFQQLSYYNAMAIALYQASRFSDCLQMLQLLTDIRPC